MTKRRKRVRHKVHRRRPRTLTGAVRTSIRKAKKKVTKSIHRVKRRL